ncbi:MAG: beta-phosphoglucomutase family hydrolase [Gammaproteobacteria bacterium]
MAAKSASVTIARDAYDAVIFDLDGVITRTAKTHAAAWKAMFDEYLQRHAAAHGEPFRPFDMDHDYRRYVDGKPRYDGVASFLASRGIHLPHGSPDDPPQKETVCGLGNRKNELFLQMVAQGGVEVYPSTVDLIRDLRAGGFKTAVVSSSKNTATILDAVRMNDLFDARVDGADAAHLGLKGKPAPDTFLEAATRLRIDPGRAVVVEDAISGVQAGRQGQFKCVIGVDRTGHPEALEAAGASVVVSDLAEVAVEPEPRTNA